MGSDSADDQSARASSSTSQAKDRLDQVANHVSQSSSAKKVPRSRRKKSDSDLPADYSDILGQIKTLRDSAAKPDTSKRGYIRQKQAGKLHVRERVDQLLDEGSFYEVGSVSGTVKWKQITSLKEEPVDFVPSNNVQGFGALKGRKILFTADDFSIRAGHADGAIWEKTVYMEKLALSMKLPIIKLVDGSSGGGSVTTIKQHGFSYVPPMPGWHFISQQLNAGIPNLGACLGPAIGLGAARVVSCHFSVMAADVGALFNAGPEVVKGATFEEGLSFTDLGGPAMHATNGTIDNLAANEAECFEQLRTVLSYLPNHGTQVPPVLGYSDDPIDRKALELRTIIPRKRERMYDPRKIITTVVDKDSWFEIGALWGTTAIVGLARLGGHPVGIVSLNCEVNAGAIDAAGARKMTRHLKFLDIFNIPLLEFVDAPGFAIGTVAERSATMRHGVGLAMAYYTSTIPIFNVIVRRAYGIAAGIMVDSRDPRVRVAWPSGEWGSLPLAGGIEVGHSHELREIAKTQGKEAAASRYKELDEEYRRLMNPVRAANNFGIEEVIDPADTRPIVCEWIRHCYEVLLPHRVLERAAGKINPSFA
ncbi:propionyl-CoA carboxylase beta chain mitochondrial precursor [Pseudovirgaria hyperparasitica]|uniref:Propionyl-CoA carboxylase beta chain mitochondrial n=1 Tax=Pseudovirgaria hyperparasitica TaxID=470096 RepID=A0A6A6WGX4_9PEZI|nr:propionyl-CoA carboxylase beta chain mitochondrial precursor [Pseudovirgaria hyperparasitica]KAF2760401.1 propionyl-CoA carboxylase beta chain mitochondrial precursor [Pseudovirgaria hyperparasitica]